MPRISTALATLDGLALLATFVLGIISRLNDAVFLVHFDLGLFTAIGTLLVHCLIFTYFLGTGRWVKKVGLAYNLPDADLPRTTRELKRSTLPPALFAMLITIATAAAGAGAQLQEWPWYVHGALALVTLAVNLWAFRLEIHYLRLNASVLDAVLAEVDRIRASHGLLDNAAALAQEKRMEIRE